MAFFELTWRMPLASVIWGSRCIEEEAGDERSQDNNCQQKSVNSGRALLHWYRTGERQSPLLSLSLRLNLFLISQSFLSGRSRLSLCFCKGWSWVCILIVFNPMNIRLSNVAHKFTTSRWVTTEREPSCKVQKIVQSFEFFKTSTCKR